MDNLIWVEDSPVDLLHEIGVRLATAGGFHDVLARVVEFASDLVKCDSCLIYVLEGEHTVRPCEAEGVAQIRLENNKISRFAKRRTRLKANIVFDEPAAQRGSN